METKHFLETDHVVMFDNKLHSVLPYVLPKQHRHLRVVPVMACMTLSSRTPREVRKYGVAVLCPDGQEAKWDTQHLRIREPTSAP